MNKKYVILLTIAILLSGCVNQPGKTTEKITSTNTPSVTVTTVAPTLTSTPTFTATPKPTSKISENTTTKDLIPKTISGYSIIDTETIVSPGDKYPKFSTAEEVSYAILSPLNSSEKESVEFAYIAVHKFSSDTELYSYMKNDVDITGYPAKILSRQPKQKFYDPKIGSGTKYSSSSSSKRVYENYVFQIGIVAQMGRDIDSSVKDNMYYNIENSAGWNEYKT